MKRKFVTIITIFVLLFCFYSFSISNAETANEENTNTATSLTQQQQQVKEQKEEAENKLEYVQEELSERLVKIQQLEDNIQTSQAEINDMEQQLSTLQTTMEETSQKLRSIENNYKENEKMLQKRLVVLYETGNVEFIDILLHSASLIDFLSNYYAIEQIVQNDTDLLKTIESQRQEVEKTKNELEEQKANLKIIKAKAEQKKVALQNNKTIQEAEMNQLTEQEKQLQESIEKYKAEEETIENLIRLASNDYVYSGEFTGGVMAWPIAKSGTYITSDYGIREHPIQGIIKKHTGMDIGNAGFGAPVIAAADGVVSMASYYGGYGNCVMINHGNGVSTLYGHGQKILTTVGTTVKKGDLIMEVGSTGNSTGPHLHFEVRINGTPVDPKPYLKSSE